MPLLLSLLSALLSAEVKSRVAELKSCDVQRFCASSRYVGGPGPRYLLDLRFSQLLARRLRLFFCDLL